MVAYPVAILFVGALGAAVLPRRFGAPWTVVVSAAALLSTLSLPKGTVLEYEFYGYEAILVRADGLSLAFATVFAIASLLASIFGYSTMSTLERSAALATVGAAVGIVLAGDLLTLFFFWETKVATSTLLVLARRSAPAAAAAHRLFGVQVASGIVLLAGILGRLAETGSLEFGPLELGGWTVLILIGFGVSAAIVPIHAWLPDAYPESTVAGTVFLSALTTKAAVYTLARGFPGTELLIWLGVTMAIYGVVFAIIENDIRRLLSYHIVSQVGFMVAAVGVGTEAAINGATAHAYAHVIYKGLLLMAAGSVLVATGRTRATELGGLARAMPWSLGFYMVGALSIAAMPLFSGFAAKELVTSSVGDAGFEAAMWLLKFASIGTFLSVVCKLPAVTWFGRGPDDLVVRRVPVTLYVGMAGAAGLSLVFGVAPVLLYDQLPFAVDFTPFTVDKVSEALVLAVGTTAGFFLLRSRLAPKPVVSVDTDWAYREFPLLVERRMSVPLAHAGTAASATSSRVRERADTRARVVASATASRLSENRSWALAGAVFAALVVVLGVNVL